MRARLLSLALLFFVTPAWLGAQQPTDPVPVRSVEVHPVLVDSSCVLPALPELLREAVVEGRVVVSVVVDTTGVVDSTSVRTVSSTSRLLEAPARAAALTCRFRPGRQGGRAVRVRMDLPLNFIFPTQPPRQRP